jgi:serine/threonine-protein kinase RsbW
VRQSRNFFAPHWPVRGAFGRLARQDRLVQIHTRRGEAVAVVDSGEHTGANVPKDAQHSDRRTVLVQVKASASELPPLRVVAADLAARAEFDLDTVADLRLAVDEAASELVAVAAPEALLTCIFSLDDRQMEVAASVPACSGATLRQDSFGWRVLTTLVDEVHASGDPDADPPILGISLCKRRPLTTLAQHR